MSNILADYNKTVIYKIQCKDQNITDTYIGHTTCYYQRYRLHKSNCTNDKAKSYNYKIYKIIRENGGWDNWDMVIVENYPCNNITEAKERERYWIETLGCNLNMRTPSRKRPERKIFFNCDCGGTYSNYNKNIHFKSNKHTKYIQTQEQEQEQEQTL